MLKFLVAWLILDVIILGLFNLVLTITGAKEEIERERRFE